LIDPHRIISLEVSLRRETVSSGNTSYRENKMSVFAPKDLFEVQVRYVMITSKGVDAVRVLEEDEKGKEEIERLGDKVQVLSTMWVIPSWKESNEILRKCMKWDEYAGKKDLDWPTYRALLIETYMRNWDAKDGDEQVECSKANIDRLDAQIGIALVDRFLDKTSLSDDEMGN
jgi:hypothetical protein